MMDSYGLVVEGYFDREVYEEFIGKICARKVEVIVRVAGDCAQLMRKLPSLLRSLEHATSPGSPVDKMLAIRDADFRDVATLEGKMRNSISGRSFKSPQPIGLHAVKQEMETWLLADTDAINAVATARGGNAVSRVADPLEDIQHPKEKLQVLLGRARLNYTAQVCREIARATDLAKLRVRCPSFNVFEQKVIDP